MGVDGKGGVLSTITIPRRDQVHAGHHGANLRRGRLQVVDFAISLAHWHVYGRRFKSTALFDHAVQTFVADHLCVP